MGRTIDLCIMARVRPLVAKGYNGTQLAEALNLKEPDARWYAQQVRAEASVLLQEWPVICYKEPRVVDPQSPETGHA
jgi:hypothetical protein